MTDRDRWNAHYAKNAPSRDCSAHPFVAAHAPCPAAFARALDIAGGAGRHAVHLAQQGYRTTLVDISDRALELALASAEQAGVALECVQHDLAVTPCPLLQQRWHCIVMIDYLDRALLPTLVHALYPGGTLIVVQATLSNLQRNPIPSARWLLLDGELKQLLLPVSRLAHYSEAWRDNGRHEAWAACTPIAD